jgi:hypothetical protein
MARLPPDLHGYDNFELGARILNNNFRVFGMHRGIARSSATRKGLRNTINIELDRTTAQRFHVLTVYCVLGQGNLNLGKIIILIDHNAGSNCRFSRVVLHSLRSRLDLEGRFQRLEESELSLDVYIVSEAIKGNNVWISPSPGGAGFFGDLNYESETKWQDEDMTVKVSTIHSFIRMYSPLVIAFSVAKKDAQDVERAASNSRSQLTLNHPPI